MGAKTTAKKTPREFAVSFFSVDYFSNFTAELHTKEWLAVSKHLRDIVYKRGRKYEIQFKWSF